MTDLQKAPAGWYRDPTDGRQRYWDGTRWTDHYSDVPIAPQPGTMAEITEAEPKNGLAIAALVIGVVALPLAIVPVFSFFAWIPAFVAVALATVALARKRGGRNLAIAGLITGGVAALLAIVISVAFTVWAINQPTPTSDTDATPVTSASASEDSSTAGSAPTPSDDSEAAAPDTADYAELDERAYALLLKNPDAHTGERFVLYGYVTQFDAATGVCSLRAGTSWAQQPSFFDYPDNAMFTAGNGKEDCSVLDPIVADDHLKMWVTVQGSVTYETQIGGATTVPLYGIDAVELLPAIEY